MIELLGKIKKLFKKDVKKFIICRKYNNNQINFREYLIIIKKRKKDKNSLPIIVGKIIFNVWMYKNI